MTLPYRPRVLFVDDDADLRRAFARSLVQTFDITQAADGALAIELLQKHSFDAIVTDLDMPNVGGDMLVTWLEVYQPKVAKRAIVLTGGAKAPVQAAWLRSFDPVRVVAKPCSIGELVRAIGDAVERSREM